MRNVLNEEILNKMITDYHNGINLIELSKAYGFEEQTIQKHFKKVGIRITRGNAKRFSNEEINNIISDYQNGMKPYELAKKYHRDAGTLIGKLQSLGIYKYTTHRFTDEEINLLRLYYPIGDWESIHQFLPNVSKQSIHTKMSSLNISMESYYWTAEEEQLLIQNYETMYGHIDELVSLFDGKYSYKAITSKAKKLGLRTRELWSDEELSILKENYSIVYLDELLKLLPKRNRRSIIAKASEYHLISKLKLDSQFSEQDIDYIYNNFNSMTDKEIANKLNREPHAISDFRHYRGLIKTYEKSSYDDIADFIRRNNGDWKKNSMINCGYKCVLSGERFDEIHHLYGFNLILEETFEIMQINVKSDINDYTHDEMMDILKCFREIQSKYPLGVCLTKEIHNLFHSQYGYGNNTIEQWNEFVNNYKMIA